MILFASHLLCDAAGLHAGGGVRIEDGRIASVYSSLRGLRRAAHLHGTRPIDLGQGVLAPGFVNAHAHLELTDVELAPSSFADWIRGVLENRARLVPGDFEQAVRKGSSRLLATGTTTVGDIDSTGAAGRLRPVRLRQVVYREVLDGWDPGRTDAVLTRVARRLPAHALRSEGLSPHAPYTTSRALLAGARRLARANGLPLTIHWSETSEELDWLERGEGALSRFLQDTPHRRGLDLLEEAGLLTRRTSLVHGNHPARGEPGRIAAAGIVLIHCPGSHAFFEREPFPWSRYRRAGVELALGTDSRASNRDLDMRRELALARRTLVGLSPAEAWEMATVKAARALGLERRVGRIRRGYEADLVLHRGISTHGVSAGSPASRGSILDALTHGQGEVAEVWVGGRARRSRRGVSS